MWRRMLQKPAREVAADPVIEWMREQVSRELRVALAVAIGVFGVGVLVLFLCGLGSIS